MSVHSLIDKFTAADERPPVPRSRSGPAALEIEKLQSSTFQRIPLIPSLDPGLQAKDSAKRRRPLTAPINTKDEFVPDPALLALLGPDVKSFPLGETAFVEALRLRAEEERSKQEQIRLQIASKNLAIVQAALQNGVPPHLIPMMCVGAVPEGTLPPQHKPDPSPQLPVYSHAPRRSFPSGDYAHAGLGYNHGQQAPVPGQHNPYGQSGPGGLAPGHQGGPYASAQGTGVPQRSPFLAPSPSIVRSYDAQDNASSVAPLNYRFGGGPKVPVPPPPPNRRPLSPAKIGAAAVANLANPVTPYRPSHRTLPTHQRHFSMPVESMSPQKSIERSSKSRGSGSLSFQLQSPLGATSSIQVRPSPAQPLNKQTRNSQIPSQESMTSFQHIIQFHHWRPENTGDRDTAEMGSISSGSLTRGLFSHKRHKSNDMSIDLLLVPQETYMRTQLSSQVLPKREADPDVSMESGDVTITERTDETSASSLAATDTGKFPHDILLKNN